MPEDRSPTPQAGNEEPEIVQEESVPSDGKDLEGEKLMEEIGRTKADPQPEKPAF